jgi:hypothetical protein
MEEHYPTLTTEAHVQDFDSLSDEDEDEEEAGRSRKKLKQSARQQSAAAEEEEEGQGPQRVHGEPLTAPPSLFAPADEAVS